MLDVNLERLQKIDREWQDIEGGYRISTYNAPLNLAEEKEAVIRAFREGVHYNPVFQYKETPDFPIQRIRQFISSLRLDDSVIDRMYYRVAENELLTIESLVTHAPDVITGCTCLYYGIPDTTLLEYARSLLAQIHDQESTDIVDESLPAEDAAVKMQDMLDKLKLGEWRAQPFSPMSAKVSVNRKDKLVKIRANAKFTSAALTRLLVHEIGVHVVRGENGQKQPLGIFARGLPGYLATEEGLAVYSEEKANVIDVSTMRKYAGRVIAANLALSQSFSDVFNSIAPDLGVDTAFEIVARAKRGFVDTSQPGAHTKDIVYLGGYRKVSQHLKENPDDYSLLFVGKIGLEDIEMTKDLLNRQIMKPAFLLPSALDD